MNKIRSLEDLNQNLTNNYQTVKDELIETRKKYNEVKETYIVTVAEKFEAEEKYESVINRVQSQLADKTREFEMVRDKLVPHDIDQLRIKVQEELEIQHKQQLQSVEQELEHQRDQFYSVKRDLERSKAEHEIIVQHLQHEIVALRGEREEVESHLRKELARLKEAEYSATFSAKHDFVKTHKAKGLEMSHSLELVKSEAATLRAERDEAKATLEKSRSEFEVSTTQLRAQLSVLEAEKHGLEEQVLRHNVEADRREAQAASYRRSAEEVHERLSKCVKELQAAEKQNNILRDDNAKQVETLADIHEAERAELQERIDALHDRLSERENILRKAQRDATDMQLRAESMEGELRRTHQLQLQEFRKKLSALEIQLADAHNSLKMNETHASQITDQGAFERDGLRSELSRVRREKEIVQSKMREMEAAAEGERSKQVALQHESASRLGAAESKVRELEGSIASLERRLRESGERQQESQTALLSAKETGVQLERRNLEQTALIEAMKREFQTQLDVLMPSYKERFESMQRKLGGEVAREKKRADAYKSKALEAHSRVKAISGSQLGNSTDNFM